MNPKVTLIVPIYNTAIYLEKCISSVLSQSLEEIEYIFINDCSTDNSSYVLNKSIANFPARADQIKIINHTQNIGISATRNEAVSIASGDYIASVDSDDFIESQMIEKLYNKAIEENADIVISDFYIEYPHKTEKHTEHYPKDNISCFESFLTEDKFTMCLWNKLIKRELYSKPECKSPEGLNYMDDKYVVAKLFYYSTKVTKVHGTFYHYCKYNPNSITTLRTKKQFEDIIWFWHIFEEFLHEQHLYDKYKKEVCIQKIKSKTSLMIGCGTIKLRKEFALMFINDEKEVLQYFKYGEQLMLFFLRNKMFICTQLLHKAFILKRDFKSNLL